MASNEAARGRPLGEGARQALASKARLTTLRGLSMLGGEATRGEVHDWAIAHGGFGPRELGAPAPRRAGDAYANAVDHALSWALTDLRRDGLLENPARGVWRLVDGPQLPASPARVSEARVLELRAMSYREYLRSPEWCRTREATLERAEYRCAMDATHTDRLDVHHNTYERLAAERRSDLIVLCHACHQRHHDGDRPAPDASTRRPSLLRRLLGRG